MALRQRGSQPLLTVSGCWHWRTAVGGGGRTRQRGACKKGGGRGGGCERGEPFLPSCHPLRLRLPLRLRRWTLSFGGEEEVAAMTATAMALRWLQRERAVDSAMRVDGGRRRKAMMIAAGMLSCEGRPWGDCDDDDGKEKVVEVDDNDETVAASAGKRAGSRNLQGGR